MSVGNTARTTAPSLRARPSRSGVDIGAGAQCAESLAALGAPFLAGDVQAASIFRPPIAPPNVTGTDYAGTELLMCC
jgi:hypothetical protein